MTDIIAQLEVEKSTLLSAIVEKDGVISQQGSVIVEKTAAISQRDATIVEKNAEIAKFKGQVAELRRMVYGTQSERFTGGQPEEKADQSPAADPAPSEPETDGKLVDEPADVPAKKPRRKPTKADELSYPADIEVERRIHEPHPSLLVDAEGRPLKKVGEQVVRKLAYRARKAYLVEDVYPIYATHETNAEFVQAPAVKSLVPSAACDSSLVAHILAAKCAYGLTFYRLQEMFAAEGVKISQQLMSSLFCRAGRELESLGDVLRESVFRSRSMNVDETTYDYIVKGQDKGKASTGYLWAYVATDGPPLVWYEFTADRSHRHPRKLLENWSGYLVADAYGAYKALHDDPAVKIQWQACWAHGRRKFEKKKDSPFAEEMLVLIRDLFMTEREAWELPEAKRLAHRQIHAVPLVDACFAKMKERLKLFPDPKNPVNAACQYFLNYEDSFRLFLSVPFLRIDNNPAERSLRRVTINRKNSLFMGSKEAGKAYAAVLSLTQSCRNLGLSPEAYFTWLFDTLGGVQLTHDALRDYLPDAYAAKTGKTVKPLF